MQQVEGAPDVEGRNPLLIVVSGPSGVGKDVVLARLCELHPDVFFAITATTRAVRPGEQHGVNHYFLTQEEFAALVERDELLEHAEVYGNHYGVPKEQIRNALAEGRHAFVRVDIQGAASIRAIAPDALLFFIAPPSFGELERRLRSRHTESAEQMAVRIETAKEEMEAAAWFEAVVVNETDAIDATVAEIMRIVEAQQHRTPRRIVRV